MESKPTILVVDDERLNLNMFAGILHDDYRVLMAKDGEQCFQRMAGEVLPDLVLLDIMMPEMDGYEVCRRLKADTRTRDVPVIFITSKSDVQDETKGLELGAVDYITKPITPAIVMARIQTHLRLRQAQQLLENYNRVLEEKVRERTHELEVTKAVTIHSLARLAETRDDETGNHLRRTQAYIKALAEHLRGHPRFKDYLDARTIEQIYNSAPLHDIGKVGVADNILKKPGQLTPAEFEEMKKHTLYGYEAILDSEKLLGSTTSFLQIGREIAYSHHEKWDGSGYPQGLKGDAIPIAGRLMALADVYDALISGRRYKDAFPHEQAVQMIREGRGTHFDPDIVDAFVEIEAQFNEIRLRYKDRLTQVLQEGYAE